jgi:hypothetical protein
MIGTAPDQAQDGIWTGSGQDLDRIWTNLDKSGQIWTNPDSRVAREIEEMW